MENKSNLDEFSESEKITNEILAVMIAKGFQGVDERFEKVDERFEKIENHLNGLDSKVGNIETRVENIETRVGHLEASVGQIQMDMQDVKDGMVYRHEYEDSLDRIKYVERKLGIESGK